MRGTSHPTAVNEKQMDKTMENNMEATIWGLGFRSFYPVTGESHGRDIEHDVRTGIT